MKKFLARLKAKQYKIIDPEYQKYVRQVAQVELWTSIIFAAIASMLLIFAPDPSNPDNFQLIDKVWIMLFLIFVMVISYCLGAALTAEAADKYQAKKDKKNDKIPTL